MASSREPSMADVVRSSLAMVGLLILITALAILLQLPFLQYGILPRTMLGLRGILFSPLLHANLSHLFANAFPLFVLLVLLLSHRSYRPYPTLAWIWFISGLGTWLIGRTSIHVGASGIVFGLVAFLIVAGLQLKDWKPALIAVLVFLLYGGIFYGALPQSGPISWEGHLCGAIAGIWRARQVRD